MIDADAMGHAFGAPLAGIVGGWACVALDAVNKPLMALIALGSIGLYILLVFVIRTIVSGIYQLIWQGSN